MLTYADIFFAILAMDTYHTGKKTIPVDNINPEATGYIHNLKKASGQSPIG